MYMCVSACTCARPQTRREHHHSIIGSITLHFIPLGQGLSLSSCLGLGWQPANPSDPPVSVPIAQELWVCGETMLGLLQGAGIQTQVFGVVQEALTPTEPPR